MVLVDALGAEAAEQRGGYLEHLVETGKAAKYQVRGELPSASRPMYETLMTGLPVSVHGVVTNRVSRRSRCENLFSLCKKHGKKTAAAAFYWFSELYNGTVPFILSKHRYLTEGDMDGGIFYQDCDYPDTHLYADGEFLRMTVRPDFLVIHPMNVDTTGHRFGCASKEYQERVDQSLQQVAELLSGWREDGYDVIVTGDHGIDEYGIHGGNTERQRCVPLYIVSDRVAGGDHTDRDVTSLDVFPLICRLLDLQMPEGRKEDGSIEFSDENERGIKPENCKIQAADEKR